MLILKIMQSQSNEAGTIEVLIIKIFFVNQP